jgi:uncharacterized membrane protein
MAHAERTITIGRPAESVYGFFTDHANDSAWRPNLVAIDAVRDAAVGTRIRQAIKGPLGRSIAADIEVTANERPRRYAFKVVTGPVRPRGEFTFSPSATGTDVQFALDAELSGIRKLLMGRSVQASMDGEMAGLDVAKRTLERA